jgi:hypothetical protein
MRKQDAGFDYDRYRKLLAEAVDEPKRLALIDLLVEERAREQLEQQRLADRKAMTARTIATILGTDRIAESPFPARPALKRPPLERPFLAGPVSAKPALEKPAKST